MKKLISFLLILSVISCADKNLDKKDNKISAQTTEKGANMNKLSNPNLLNETAPENFKVRFKTTKGDFLVEVKREWAPKGADRFYNLVKNGFYNEAAFFRVIKGFVAQFGINKDPNISAKWREAVIDDDPVKISNSRGTISFATAGPNTRTTQLFINFKDNQRLDSMGFSPFAKVIEGMNVVDNLYSDYGEGEPYGNGPSQSKIQTEGNSYLKSYFPKLDYIISTEIILN
ncbi:MAG: peptidylprolyl isomerase [Elusimicrobiales bacterium]